MDERLPGQLSIPVELIFVGSSVSESPMIVVVRKGEAGCQVEKKDHQVKGPEWN